MLLAQQTTRPLIEFTLTPLWEEHGIPLAVMGIFVVFSALLLVLVFLTLLPRLFPPPKRGVVRAAQPVVGEGRLSPEKIAVIAAAVAETIRKPHRIVRIRGLTADDLGWSLEGRLQHHQSHRIRRDSR